MANMDRVNSPDGTTLMGEWIVDASGGRLRRRYPPFDELCLNRRLMKVLGVLIAADGKLVPAADILDLAWKGRVVSGDSVSTAIYQLRKALGDDSTAPQYIETIPNEGYRLVARVTDQKKGLSRHPIFRWAVAASVAAITITAVAWHFSGQHDARTVYVPPVINSTGIASNDGVSIMLRSRLMNAMGENAPEIVATVSNDVASGFTLESEMVGCAAGPAIIFRLVETDSQRHVWSQHYDMRPNTYEAEVLEMAIERVANTLDDSASGTLVFEEAGEDQPAKKL